MSQGGWSFLGIQLSRRPQRPLVFLFRSPGSRCEMKDGFDDGHYPGQFVGRCEIPDRC